MIKQRIQVVLLITIFLVLGGCSSKEVGKTNPGSFEQKYWVEDYVTQLNFPLVDDLAPRRYPLNYRAAGKD